MVVKALESFVETGGLVLLTGDSTVSIKGAIKENPETQPKAFGARTIDVTQLIGIDDENDGQCRVSRRIPVDEKGHFTHG